MVAVCTFSVSRNCCCNAQHLSSRAVSLPAAFLLAGEPLGLCQACVQILVAVS